MDYLQDQTFKLYRGNQLPVISESDETYLKENIANYLAINSKLANELTAKDAIDRLTIQQITNKTSKYTLNITKISAPDVVPIQLVVCVLRNAEESSGMNALILIKSSLVKVLIQLLENLPSCSDPIVIQKHTLSPEYLRSTINAIADNLHTFVLELSVKKTVMNKLVLESFGNVELNYVVGGSHLNSIAMNIPKADIQNLLDNSQEPLVQSLDAFMVKNTQIKFSKLNLSQFFSNLIFLSSNGHIKLFKAHIDKFTQVLESTLNEHGLLTDTDYKQRFIIFIIESLHSYTQ